MKPGVFDMPDDEYHRHPALSSTGARKLLPPSTPAAFKWERDNPPKSTKAMGFGSLAHRGVLGAGPDIHVVDADSWRTKAAQEERHEYEAQGHIVMLPKDMAVVNAMAKAIRAHPLANKLLTNAKAEQALFWTCQETGVECRALVDMLRNGIAVDYKTTDDAEPETFRRRAVYKYRYDVQGAWYLDGIRTLGLHEAPTFILVAQEKDPPYLVSVSQLGQEALDVAHRRVIRAREIYRECVEKDEWPGYPAEIETVHPPDWAVKEAAA